MTVFFIMAMDGRRGSVVDRRGGRRQVPKSWRAMMTIGIEMMCGEDFLLLVVGLRSELCGTMLYRMYLYHTLYLYVQYGTVQVK